MQQEQVFVVLIEERHGDPEIEVWSNADEAKGRARQVAQSYAESYDSDIHEADDPNYGLASGWDEGPDAWLFWLGWGGEGDSVRVQARPVNGRPS